MPAFGLPQMTGNQNVEGSMADSLARLGLGVPQLSIYDSLFVFWSNRTCEPARPAAAARDLGAHAGVAGSLA